MGAAIGAGGAVIAQALASAFNGRQEARRLAWDQAKQQREEMTRRIELFLDAKRSLYGNFLAIASEAIAYLTEKISAKESGSSLEMPNLKRFGQVQEEIELLADPIVSNPVKRAGYCLALLMRNLEPDSPIIYVYEEIGEEEFDNTYDEAMDNLSKAQAAMKADLRPTNVSDAVDVARMNKGAAAEI
jgi:hypothetical protein